MIGFGFRSGLIFIQDLDPEIMPAMVDFRGIKFDRKSESSSFKSLPAGPKTPGLENISNPNHELEPCSDQQTFPILIHFFQAIIQQFATETKYLNCNSEFSAGD